MKAIIHVGLSKTATSVMQHTWRTNISKFLERGIYIPNTFANTAVNRHSGNSEYFIDSILGCIDDTDTLRNIIQQYLENIVDYASHNKCDTILLTSEFYSSITKISFWALFSDVMERMGVLLEIALIKREAFEWLFSAWAQTVKDGNRTWFSDLNNEHLEEYANIFLIKELIFDKLNFNVILHDFSLVKQNPGEFAFRMLGVDPSCCEIANQRHNVGLSKVQLIILTLINRSFSGSQRIANQICDLVERNGTTSTPCRFSDINNSHEVNDAFSFIIKSKLSNSWPLDNVSNNVNYTDDSELLSILKQGGVEVGELASNIKLILSTSKDFISSMHVTLINSASHYRNSPYKDFFHVDLSLTAYYTYFPELLLSASDPYQHYFLVGQYKLMEDALTFADYILKLRSVHDSPNNLDSLSKFYINNPQQLIDRVEVTPEQLALIINKSQ